VAAGPGGGDAARPGRADRPDDDRNRRHRAFELASERHWNGLEQYVPWLALILLLVATVLVLLPGDRGTTAARVLALVVLGASAYGVVEHVLVNLQAGEFDQRFADTWESLPLVEQVLYAVTKTVGPAPTPGARRARPGGPAAAPRHGVPARQGWGDPVVGRLAGGVATPAGPSAASPPVPRGYECEQLVDRPLVVGVRAALAGQHPAVGCDQEVGR
jgi:hypothetical protein